MGLWEGHSLLPEPVNAYDMTAQTLTLAALGTSESLLFLIVNNGATFVNMTDIVDVTGTFLINGNPISDADLIARINTGEVIVVEIQGTFTTLTFSPETYFLGFLASTTELLTEKESRRIVNNTLLRNPSIQLQNDKFNHYWDMNDDGPIDLIGRVDGALTPPFVNIDSLR